MYTVIQQVNGQTQFCLYNGHVTVENGKIALINAVKVASYPEAPEDAEILVVDKIVPQN